MKKILSAVLVLMLLIPTAMAEVDLSALSFDELVALRQQVNKEITTRPEWKEVTVPAGLWKVGEDIPAGKWTISAAPGSWPWVTIGDALNALGTEVDELSSIISSYDPLMSKTHSFYEQLHGQYPESFVATLTEGLYVYIQNGTTIFSPYVGRPSLGF